MKYNLVLFDADDTLFDFGKCEETALQMAFESYHLDYKPQSHLKLYKEINRTLWSQLEKGTIDKDQLKVERFSQLFHNLGLKVDPIQFADLYLNFLSEQAFLINGTEEILSAIYGKCKIVVITNGIKDVQYKRMENSKIKHYIDALVVSEEVGYPKPQKQIFDFTLSKVDHDKKDNVIIVGDNLYSDIAGGNLFGIETCWFNPHNFENNSDILPTYEIKNLKELLPIFDIRQ